MTSPAERPASLRIGLLWHSLSSGNLGVDALTVANMAIVKEVAEACDCAPRFLVLGMRDNAAPGHAGETATFVIDRKSLLSPGGLWRCIGGLDCVIDIGAGDSFAQIYGPKRFFFLWLSKMIAVARRVPLLLAPQTIGPFSGRLYRMLAAMALKWSWAVVARDIPSFEATKSLAPTARVMLATDVAFKLPYADRSSLRGGAPLRVGVNASGLLFHEAETGRNRFGLSYDYRRFILALLEQLSARDDVEIHLIPHATSRTDPSDDDGQLADRLAALFPKAKRVPDFEGASAAKSYISSLDFLVAGRMHACIAAVSTGTPVLPTAYSRKFRGLFSTLGYERSIPVTGFDEAAACAAVTTALDQRLEIQNEISRAMGTVDRLLDAYRQALRELFVSLAENRR